MLKRPPSQPVQPEQARLKQDEGHDEAVEKERIGQGRDNRVQGRVEQPVIIPEEELVEINKKIVEVHGHDSRQHHRNNRCHLHRTNQAPPFLQSL